MSSEREGKNDFVSDGFETASKTPLNGLSSISRTSSKEFTIDSACWTTFFKLPDLPNTDAYSVTPCPSSRSACVTFVAKNFHRNVRIP